MKLKFKGCESYMNESGRGCNDPMYIKNSISKKFLHVYKSQLFLPIRTLIVRSNLLDLRNLKEQIKKLANVITLG